MLFFGQNKFLANFVRNSYIISDNLCEFLYSKAVVSNIGYCDKPLVYVR